MGELTLYTQLINTVDVKKSRSMYYEQHGVVDFLGGGRERGRDRCKWSRALHPTRPQTVGHVGVCDQEEGVIECFFFARAVDVRLCEGRARLRREQK